MTATEKLEGEFQPHIAYVRPGNEQPFDESESLTDREPLGYATPDAYDETVTQYQDPREDLVPYPVFLVPAPWDTPDKDRRVSLNTYLPGTRPIQVVSQWNQDRRLVFQNASASEEIFLSETNNGHSGFTLNAGKELELTATGELYAWSNVDDGTAILAVAQEHDAET